MTGHIVLAAFCLAVGGGAGWCVARIQEAVKARGWISVIKKTFATETHKVDLSNARRVRAKGDQPVLTPDQIPELRTPMAPKPEPKTSKNVQHLQARNASLMELLSAVGLGTEARELCEAIDAEFS